MKCFKKVLAGILTMAMIISSTEIASAIETLEMEISAIETSTETTEQSEVVEETEKVTESDLSEGVSSRAQKSGTLGDNGGFQWTYDTETKTLTVTGEDSGLCSNISPFHLTDYLMEKIIFQDCKFKGSMSHLCSSLSKLEKVEFVNCNTAEVTDMSYMFQGCNSLSSVDLSEFDTSQVTDMNSMFYSCTSLSSVDVSGFDTSRVTDMSYMFNFCSSLSSVDVSGFDTSQVTDMGHMFCSCSSLSSVDVSGFDTSQVMDMSWMFMDCASLSSVDVSGFDTSQVTNIGGMFSGCNSLSSVDVSGFDTSQVTDMAYMFISCSSLSSVDLSGFDTSQVTDMEAMFASCSSLSNVDVSEFDMSHVTDMRWMFSGCSSLSSIELPSGVTEIGESAFEGCSSLSGIDLPSGVTEIGISAFKDCSSLRSIKMTDRVTKIGDSAFSGCSNFIIYGVAGSYAHTYAKEHNIPFLGNISKDAVAEEVLSNINLNTLISDISIDGTTIKGPNVTIAGKTFNLFSLDASAALKLSDKLQAKVDTKNKTVQILIGFKKFSGSADLSADKNSTAYWSESYQQVKSLYTGITGKGVHTTKLWNQFSKLRGKLKKVNGSMGIKADASVAGYLEFSYASGTLVYSEGGLVMEAALGSSVDMKWPPCPALYVTFGVEADFNGELKLVRENVMRYTPAMDADIDLVATLGTGAGSKKFNTYAEIGMKGALELGMKLPAKSMEDALTAALTASVYFESKVFGFNGPSYGPQEFASYPIYPRYTDLQLFGGEDLTEYDFAKATLMERNYLNDTENVRLNLKADDMMYEKNNLYPYANPNLARLNDGTMILVWIDDDGIKSDVNKTSLVYSVFDGNSWSSVKTIVESGGANDYPSVYSDGERVHIVWQKASELSDDATLEDLLKSVEVYYVTYENGKMGDAVQITKNNAIYEMMNTVASNGTKTAVAWVENTANNPFQSEGTNTIKVKEYVEGVWTEKVIAEDLADVSGLNLYYLNDNLIIVYEHELEGKSNIVINNGKTEEVVLGYAPAVANGIVYYSSSEGMMSYDMRTKAKENIGLPSLGQCTVLDNGLETYIFTTIYDGYESELTAYTFDYAAGVWSNSIVLTDENKYIRNYSPVLDNSGKIITACNFVDIDSESEKIYGTANMSVFYIAEDMDLYLDPVSVYYDESSLEPGAVLPINFTVTNNGLEDVEELQVSLFDEAGTVLSEETVTCSIAAGATAETYVNYQIPEILTYSTLTLKVVTENEEKLSDNTAELEIGNPDISIKNTWLSGNFSEASAVVTIANMGYADAETITVNIYKENSEGALVGTATIDMLESQQEGTAIVSVSEDYLNVNPFASGVSFYVTVDTKSNELNFGNNSTQFFVTSFEDLPIKLNYDELQLKAQEKKQLSVTYINSADWNEAEVIWTSSDESVVSVLGGLVTAIGEGTAEVTAEINGQRAVCIVTVDNTTPVTGIYIEESSVQLLLNESKTLTAHVLPVEASNQNITWQTSDDSVVSVSQTGKITGVSLGMAQVSAVSEDGYKIAYATVTVLQDVIQEHTLSFSGGDGSAGKTPTPIKGKSGDIILLPENTYTKPDMIFVGWSDGTDIYKAGSHYLIKYSDVTFYAQWKRATISIEKTTIQLPESCTYDGTAKTPKVTVFYQNKELIQDVDYTVTYANNINVGTATVTITGKGNYTGTVEKTFTITSSTASGDIKAENITVTYDGNAYGIKVIGTLPTGADICYGTVKGTYNLKSSPTYANVGTYTVYYKVTANGYHAVEGSATITIQSKSITTIEINAFKDVVYTGKALTPSVVIKDNGKQLVKDKDYTVTYANNINVGTASVTITGKGNYMGTIVKTFTITSATTSRDIKAENVTVIYNGKSYGIKVIGTLPAGAVISYGTVKGTYNLKSSPTYANVGTYTVYYKVTANGYHAVEGSATITIQPKSITTAEINAFKDAVYTSKALMPSVVIKDNGKQLAKDKDYIVSYSNNKNIGTAKVTITGKGNYTGTVQKTFAIKIRTGDTFTVGKYKYKITNTSTVDFAGIKSSSTTKVTIAKTVTIGGKSFKVTSIANNALKNQKKVTQVTIGANVKTIGSSAFENCTKLSKVTIGSSVTTIKKKAFQKCTALKSITIPSKVSKIETQALYGCKNLKTIIMNSTMLKTVGKNALKGINSKTVIKVPTSKYASYKKLLAKKGQGKKVSIVINPKKNDTFIFGNNKYKVITSTTVEFIGLKGTKTTTVFVPKIETYGGKTFKVTSIAKNALKGNTKVKTLIIGENIKSIGASAFYGCKKLKTITIKSTQLKTIGSRAFKGIYSKAKIQVPGSKLKAYKKLLKNKGQGAKVTIVKIR